jgi:hypothetical protein
VSFRYPVVAWCSVPAFVSNRKIALLLVDEGRA